MALTEKKLAPYQQALLVFAAGFLLMSAGVLLDKAGIFGMERLYPWTIATGFLLLFALFNSISSLQADSFVKYWGASIYSFMGLALVNGLAAWWLSGVSIGDAESYKFIYLVVAFGFLVFLSMVNFMKKIVQFAEREEWTQPRRRR
ncbi:MAG: hypothetical protein ACK5SQ_08295 [Chitinophagales bacterium]|jgi:hypothetical protein